MRGRRLRAAAVLTGLIAGLAVASPALAASELITTPARVFPDYKKLGGPAFAGDGVAWSAWDPPASYQIALERPGGRSVQHVTGVDGEIVTQQLAGSQRRLAFGLDVLDCHGSGCKYQDYQEAQQEAWSGSLGEPLEPLPGCSTESASVDVSGDAVAYGSSCAGGVTVRDFAPGATPYWRTFPGYYSARIAGDYLAVEEHTTVPPEPFLSRVKVYNWRTGDELFKVDAAGFYATLPFDIQPDGKLAYTRAQSGTPNRELDWASPAEPTPHRITDVNPYGLRMSDDRVALVSFGTYRVVDLAGHVLADAHDPNNVNLGDFDFDGKRLTWATQPCAVVGIVVWDLTGAPPAMPAGECPTARVESARAYQRKHKVRVVLSCPDQPALGCAGELLLELPTDYIPAARFNLAPGERRRVRLTLSRPQGCRLERMKRTPPFLLSTYARREPRPANVRPRIRAKRVGHPRYCKPRRRAHSRS